MPLSAVTQMLLSPLCTLRISKADATTEVTPSESTESVTLMIILAENRELHVTFGVGIPLTVKLMRAVCRQTTGSGIRKLLTTGSTRTKFI